MGRAAADEWAPVLCDGAPDFRVDVLVGKVDRRRAEPADERAGDRARGDYGDEDLDGRDADPRERERPGRGEVGTSVRSHDPSIGLRTERLETKGLPAPRRRRRTARRQRTTGSVGT